MKCSSVKGTVEWNIEQSPAMANESKVTGNRNQPGATGGFGAKHSTHKF